MTPPLQQPTVFFHRRSSRWHLAWSLPVGLLLGLIQFVLAFGSDAQVVGSRTALYYVPSAFLREFIAVMVEHKWLNLLAVATFAMLVGFGIWESFQMR